MNIEQIENVLAQLYGLTGKVSPLAGEYDDNFHLETANGQEFLLKISHSKEEQANVMMQNAVLEHLGAQAQSFYYPHLQATINQEWIGHATLDHSQRMLRVFTYLPDKLMAEIKQPSQALIENLGIQLAHLTLALQGLQHETAKRYSQWDLKQALWMQAQLTQIENVKDREYAAACLKIFASEVRPVLPFLRQSIIHGDINNYNVMVAADGETVSGFIDFGDVVETATICELAIALAYVMLDKPDPIASAMQMIKAYHRAYPLQENEIDILFHLICIRLCMTVVVAAIRKKEEENQAYLTISEKPAWDLLKKLCAMDAMLVTAGIREVCQLPSSNQENIYAARKKWLGRNLKLAYEKPLHLVRGLGPYLFDEEGRRYVDCVNNVAHVGHCHPKVVAAGQEQMARLNTNTRYLHENLSHYAERLVATLPAPLEVCFFVCSGSEANELALRMAETHSKGSHFLVIDHAYHGNTSRLIDLSPYKFNGPGGRRKPDYVAVLPMLHEGEDLASLDLKLAEIDANLAAFIGESLISCGGQVILPAQYLQHVYKAVRQAGGACIADEVQVGLGRVGSHFWGFETQGVVPDIVTIGKPLGNGYPMAAVVTTREIAESFNNGMEYFNTFGGNPVACAIGLAVLDVLAEENLQANAFTVGNYFKSQLEHLKEEYACVHAVRGMGLFLGIELLLVDQVPEETRRLSAKIVNQMKERGVLLSADGPLGNVIKIKPPLVFSREDADVVVGNLREVLKS